MARGEASRWRAALRPSKAGEFTLKTLAASAWTESVAPVERAQGRGGQHRALPRVTPEG